MKPGSISATSGPACRCSRCDRWPAVRRSTVLTCMRHSRRFSKRMSTPLPISAASFACFVMTIWRVPCERSCAATGGRRRCGFMAFRSHWRFAAEFCTPGEGHENGGIEGEGGYFRRNHLVPVPRVADLDALNTMLVTACRADEARILDGRTDTVGAAMAIERGHLLSCASGGVDLAEVVFPLVDKQSCVYGEGQLLLGASPCGTHAWKCASIRCIVEGPGMPAIGSPATSVAMVAASMCSISSTILMC